MSKYYSWVYTDTDSYVVKVETDDLYEDFKGD